MTPRFRLWMTIAQAALFTLIVAMFIGTTYTVGPAVETRLWPVVSKLRIIDIQAIGPSSLVTAEFTKLRNCTYIGISWYRREKQADGKEVIFRLPVILRRDPGDTSSPNRPVGTTRAGPWELVGANPAQITDQSFAILQHTCHPFWTTTTEFYP